MNLQQEAMAELARRELERRKQADTGRPNVLEEPESTQDALRKALAYRMNMPQQSTSGLPAAIAGLEKAEAKSKGTKKMSGEQMKRFGSARMAAQALSDIESALEGKSTILPEFMTMGTGDTDFTEAARRFAEGFGRMQSGAAITADEETRFKRLLPRIQDSPEMRAKKVAVLKEDEFKKRQIVKQRLQGTVR